jgi:hypothetical protein
MNESQEISTFYQNLIQSKLLPIFSVQEALALSLTYSGDDRYRDGHSGVIAQLGDSYRELSYCEIRTIVRVFTENIFREVLDFNHLYCARLGELNKRCSSFPNDALRKQALELVMRTLDVKDVIAKHNTLLNGMMNSVALEITAELLDVGKDKIAAAFVKKD